MNTYRLLILCDIANYIIYDYVGPVMCEYDTLCHTLSCSGGPLNFSYN